MKNLTMAGLGLALAAASPASAQTEPQFTEAQFRIDKQHLVPLGQGVLELKTTEARGGSVVLEVDRGVRVRFRDDGRELDDRADDGTFTGAVPADMNEERQIFTRAVQSLRRDIPVSIFEGRELVRRTRSSKFLKKVRPGVMPVFPVGVLTTVDPDQSLFITNTDVLDDPEYSYNPCTHTGNLDGPWAFAHAWTELAGTNDPAQFAAEWVDTWSVDQTVNGKTVEPRIDTWNRIRNAWDTDEFGVSDGILAMEDAPFHPVAITLRIDLRKTSGYGNGGNAGEARIVYSFVDDSCEAGPEGFLVIFEYAINKTGCDVKEWGQRWADLSDFDLPGDLAEYQEALSELTLEFTDLTTNPNGNALGQLRTNELEEIIVEPWQMREFILNESGQLEPTTVKLTPMTAINESPAVADIVNSMSFGVPDPLFFELEIGPASDLPFHPFDFFWTDTTDPTLTQIDDNEDRHDFSLNTCSGCHGGETQTFFTHVTWTPPGIEAPLSGFIEGMTMEDPMDSDTDREFGEKERRRQDLQNLIDNSCFGGFTQVPADFVH